MSTETRDKSNHVTGTRLIHLDRIRPGKWSRQDGVDELAESIEDAGLLQPIVVRPLKGADDEYEIIAGGRRWAAAKKAHRFDILAKVVVADDVTAEIMALTENLHRLQLSNEVEAAARLAELLSQKYGTHHRAGAESSHEGQRTVDVIAEVAEVMGKSERAARRDIKIGQKGTAKLQEAVAEGCISKNEADKISGLPPEQQDIHVDQLLAAKTSSKERRAIVDSPSKDDQKMRVEKLIKQVVREIQKARADSEWCDEDSHDLAEIIEPLTTVLEAIQPEVDRFRAEGEIDEEEYPLPPSKRVE